MKKIFLLAVVLVLALTACNTEQANTAETTVTRKANTVKPNVLNEKQISTKRQLQESNKATAQRLSNEKIEAAVTAGNSNFKWYTLEEAMEANKKEPKKFMIDMYTDWCGWCKVMDQKTFSKKEVQDYLDDNFYAIKFNAERKDKMSFKGEDFEFLNQGRRGIHGLAYKLLNGRASYPTIVYLDEQMNPIRTAPGFKKVEQIMPELKYVGENAYKTKSLREFQANS